MQPRSTALMYLFACSTLASSLAHAIVGPQQLDISGPAGSTAFGKTVTVLPNGNIVVTDPAFTAPTVGAPSGIGAVYLYSPAGALISTLKGTQTNDSVGSEGITVLKNGNFVIHSPDWDSGGVIDAGAVTWASGTLGISTTVGFANSVIGSSANDSVGQFKAVALTNGNYVLPCPLWDLGLNQDAGAVAWSNGSTGRVGQLLPSNALVGTQMNDRVGLRVNNLSNSSGVVALSNGNYVVASSFWRNGLTAKTGAITWGNGSAITAGELSNANSLVGTHDGDGLGGSNGAIGGHVGNVFALSNGNYVITSPEWNNGFGAVSWANGNTGLTGNVSNSNALIGKSGDFVGSGGITELSTGRYVISSPLWSTATVSKVGAVTWIGLGGTLANVVTAANSLVGAKSGDQVGTKVVALSNGHFVVASPLWDGTASNTGAVTWVNGNTGFIGAVAAGNSLVGTSPEDKVGEYLSPLSNGNYVITSPRWDKGALQNVGAVTLGLALGTTGTVSALNSLTGNSNNDNIGESVKGEGATPLSNGNFVVASPFWDNGLLTNVGAATWVDGNTGPFSVISPANSLVGSDVGDQVGRQVQALSDGNYVVNSPIWNPSSIGAVTWANGASGRVGPVTAGNSLVGSLNADRVGFGGSSVVSNGGYIVLSPVLDAAGGVIDTGAVTLVRSGGVSGLVNGNNSVRGTAASGGQNLVFDYDAVRANLVVGRPDSNILSIFNLPDAYLVDGFETVL